MRLLKFWVFHQYGKGTRERWIAMPQPDVIKARVRSVVRCCMGNFVKIIWLVLISLDTIVLILRDLNPHLGVNFNFS